MAESVIELLYKHSLSKSNKICLIDDKCRINYNEFFRYFLGFSRYLSSLGVGKGDCVPIITSQNVQFFIAGMAVQLSGGVFIPLESQIADERLEEIIKSTESKVLISPRRNVDYVLNVRSDEALDHYYGGGIPESEIGFPASDDLAEILFTTGTTGKSKGVLVTHANNLVLAENVIEAVHMSDDNRQIIPGPYNHSNAIRRYYANMVKGACVVTANGVSFIQKFLNKIREHKVTSMALVPSFVTILLKNAKEEFGALKEQIDYLEVAGSIFPASDKKIMCELFPSTRQYDFYGCTEAGCACTMDYNANKDRMDSVGKPTTNAIFKFFDETGCEVDGNMNNPGYFATGGSMVMPGYFKDPELTAETKRDGFVVSKDFGYRDENGYLYVKGRKDDVINMGSIKISPYEIEDAVNQYTGIFDSVCVAVKDEIFGEVPKLFIVMDEGESLNVEDVKHFLKKKIDPSMIPREFGEIASIPLNANGKKDRRSLKA